METSTKKRFSTRVRENPKFSLPRDKPKRYGCGRSGVAGTLAKKSICSEGRHAKDFSSVLNSVPETLPRMLKKHAAKDGASPATRRTKSDKLLGILSLSLFFLCGGEFPKNTSFFPFDQKGHFSTDCIMITIGDVQQVDSTFSNNPEKLSLFGGGSNGSAFT